MTIGYIMRASVTRNDTERLAALVAELMHTGIFEVGV